MTPQKRPESSVYQVRPTVTLAGQGRVRLPARSSGSMRKADAVAMEQTLRDLPLMGYSDLIERYIADPTLTPAELHAAKLSGRLDQLRQPDRSLSEVVAEAKLGVKDARTLTGFDDLLRLVPDGARLSLLTKPNNVKDLLLKHEEEGRRRNSVRRSLYRAMVLTLDRGHSRSKRIEIMEEVRYSPEDDERKLPITQELVERLLREVLDPVMLELVRVALGTGIDLAPILRIRPRHLTADGRLVVIDTKNKARERTIRGVPDEVQGAIRRAAMLGRCGPDDLVFQFTRWQVRDHFDAAVERAEIYFDIYGKLRFKDLRAIFATAYLASGGKLKDMMSIMGLTRRETAVRYSKMVPDDHEADMRAAAKWLGINRYLEAVG